MVMQVEPSDTHPTIEIEAYRYLNFPCLWLFVPGVDCQADATVLVCRESRACFGGLKVSLIISARNGGELLRFLLVLYLGAIL